MKKIFTVATCVIMLFSFSSAQKASKEKKDKKDKKEKTEQAAAPGNKLSKDEAFWIKDELKNYIKNPEVYKAKMEANQAAIDSSEIQIKQLSQDLAAANAKQAELENKLSECDAQLKSQEEEKREIKDKTEETSTSTSAPAPSRGIIYKVQLGMYRGLNINKDFDQPKAIGYEEVDGMNRYVISYFADEQTAKNFVNDIRKLGIKDAFVAKYIDGTRVYEWNENPKYKGKKAPNSLHDALQENQPKRGSKTKPEEN